MQTRKSALLLFSSFLAGALSIRAIESDPAEAARAMVEFERKFYQTGQKKGTRAAFLTFLADDAIVFRPGPVNGKETWEKRAETGLDLIWEPTFAAIARSGDFGYTTGPAKWRTNKKEEKFSGYGQFVSIWKKQKDNSWKVALDLGIENPEPIGKPESLRTSIPNSSDAKVDVEARQQKLQDTQQTFSQAAKTNFGDAIQLSAAEEVRIYRDGSFPALGKGAAKALINRSPKAISFEPMGGDISRSADLAYSYGKYSAVRDGSSETGHFFQIWKIDTTGSWKLVLDWQQVLPREKP